MIVHDDAAVGPYERVVVASDARTGLRAVVAVHSTTLGPAIGGTRFAAYPSDASAAVDALRLAEAMTLKAAAAGLDAGGGKAVIAGDPRRLGGPALWRAYARVLDRLEGTFYTAEDVGTTPADVAEIARHSPYVLGLPESLGGGGDPSPHTARGVVAAIRGAWRAEAAEPLEGVHVAVQGLGKVGAEVARGLAAEGARLTLSDIDGGRLAALATELGARAVPPDELVLTDCDVLAPCALGGVLAPATVPELRCRVVAGSANNQLAFDAVADRLAARGVVYVPDFVVNAGGLVSVAAERTGWDRERVREGVDAIEDRVGDLLAAAQAEGITPLEAARRLAAERLSRSGDRLGASRVPHATSAVGAGR